MITSLCLRGLGHAIASGYVTMASFLCTWKKCLFLLSLLFPCVAYSCAVVDEKDHTTGAIQLEFFLKRRQRFLGHGEPCLKPPSKENGRKEHFMSYLFYPFLGWQVYREGTLRLGCTQGTLEPPIKFRPNFNQMHCNTQAFTESA